LVGVVTTMNTYSSFQSNHYEALVFDPLLLADVVSAC